MYIPAHAEGGETSRVWTAVLNNSKSGDPALHRSLPLPFFPIATEPIAANEMVLATAGCCLVFR